MSNLLASSSVDRASPEAAEAQSIQAIPAQQADLGGLPIRRLLPRARRRMVGAWCFLDAFGPLAVAGGTKPMDVPPHPHIGLQTVSWLLDGEVLHHDSLGCTGLARPGVLNLMTAGRGIAHSEETPPGSAGGLHGVQLWVALPETERRVEPSFEQHADLPTVELDRGQATVLLGALAGVRSPASTFSPIVGADLTLEPGARLRLPVEPGFEHALVPLVGAARIEDQALAVDTLYYLGTGRDALDVAAIDGPARLLLLGGAPFGETILMWWNFVARSFEEIVAARADWQAGRAFGVVAAYQGRRLDAPEVVARPVAGA